MAPIIKEKYILPKNMMYFTVGNVIKMFDDLKKVYSDLNSQSFLSTKENFFIENFEDFLETAINDGKVFLTDTNNRNKEYDLSSVNFMARMYNGSITKKSPISKKSVDKLVEDYLSSA